MSSLPTDIGSRSAASRPAAEAHAHVHAPGAASPAAGGSALMLSAPERLLAAAILSAVLWAGVFWAVH